MLAAKLRDGGANAVDITFDERIVERQLMLLVLGRRLLRGGGRRRGRLLHRGRAAVLLGTSVLDVDRLRQGVGAGRRGLCGGGGDGLRRGRGIAGGMLAATGASRADDEDRQQRTGATNRAR